MIEFELLGKSYGEKAVLSGVNLSLPSSGLFFLLGPNGSGKTTSLYFGLVWPLINYGQFLCDYPEGYGAVYGSAYGNVSFLWFYRPSWLLLLSVVYLLPSLLGGLIALRKKR